MYKYLFMLIILVFSGCHKQVRYITEENETGIASAADDEISALQDTLSNFNSQQENITIPGVVHLMNIENIPVEDIIRTWFQSDRETAVEIEFADNSIFYIREFDGSFNLITENFYPYKIEENNIIIENTDKSNEFNEYVNHYLLSSNSYIYIIKREYSTGLYFDKIYPRNTWATYNDWTVFNKITMKEVIEASDGRSYYENKLKKFVYDEMLNGLIFQGDINDINGVINTYGAPIKDEVTEYSDGQRYEGGLSLSGIREIRYEDLVHRYYVFTNRRNSIIQFYVDVIADKKINRLEMINVGAASEDVIEAFGSNYRRKDGEDIIYMWGGDGEDDLRWVKFTIKDNIVMEISYIITSWGGW
ncbi:MAG: hypothetical protein LBB81_07200 [Treponema sp.]|jgi:hypothetical protein|nr:hypothetical protein [Treponema sp.]